ncbi:LysR family transcriptional regulator [Shimia sediminis]|uniref:LysR family transcriptional regulator n=1 Tax=Shimia sediminis TaxID=2497945 RepID=UPI000F8DB847|nr:LysR family transcriptional regulator [Shimia sediminis]
MSVKPPRPPSPPLTALRAFEAAARLGGFKRAAEELCVTPGAVAQQVKQLEAWAGAPLFERRVHGVALTKAGLATLAPLTEAFDQVAASVQVLRQATAPNQVHIAALPAIAQLWLAPRMPALRQLLPDLTLSVTAMETPPNLAREPYDLAIFYGDEGDVVLDDDVIFPVCTAELAKRLSTPHDLARVPCISDAVWSGDWRLWLDHVGASQVVPQGPVLSLYALAVEDALSGAGVLMAHASLVRPHLEKGTLIAPFPQHLKLARQMYLTARSGPQSQALRQLVSTLSGESSL